MIFRALLASWSTHGVVGMRFLFVLILLAGAVIGIAYPWAMTNFCAVEIGTWRVYEQDSFNPVTVPLAARDAPVRCWSTSGKGRAHRFAAARGC